ncbi:helix-turn-helix domain-containing protein [Micromonospora violae]|uniref:helix-turn-helix domain-containing protein n=1 Tax=Micromonospora violae TaxID=1278207 RepID=UPI0024492140|nr:helix-turn-helix transcriptional regulator [Micromonospora violae]
MRDLSQRQLAALAEVDQAAVARFERGPITPPATPPDVTEPEWSFASGSPDAPSAARGSTGRGGQAHQDVECYR